MSGDERRFKVAAVQSSPVLFSRDGTTEKVPNAFEGCVREGVQMAVFPETNIPDYPYLTCLNPPAVVAGLRQGFTRKRLKLNFEPTWCRKPNSLA